jgi:hypothetical protein
MFRQQRRQNLRHSGSHGKRDHQHAHDPTGQACDAMRHMFPSLAHHSGCASKQYDIELFL